MTYKNILFALMLSFIITCKSSDIENEYKVWFESDTGQKITSTNFEMRPHINWVPSYTPVEVGGVITKFTAKSVAPIDKVYNWFYLKLKIQNTSSHDLVLNKVFDQVKYYGGDKVSAELSGTYKSGCKFDPKACNACFPRTIKPGKTENVMVYDPYTSDTDPFYTGNNALACLIGLNDEKIYQSARVTVSVEVVSETEGTLKQDAIIFAKPREDYSSNNIFERLYCSDGKTICPTPADEQPWKWGDAIHDATAASTDDCMCNQAVDTNGDGFTDATFGSCSCDVSEE